MWNEKGELKMAEAAIATAAIVSAVASVGAATNSYVQGQQANRRAKNQAKAQQAEINRQKEIELGERKNLIDQQRMQLGGGGSGTRGTSSAGVRAKISSGTETLG